MFATYETYENYCYVQELESSVTCECCGDPIFHEYGELLDGYSIDGVYYHDTCLDNIFQKLPSSFETEDDTAICKCSKCGTDIWGTDDGQLYDSKIFCTDCVTEYLEENKGI